MIALPLYLTFVATAVALIAIPGPNVALIVANSVAHGTRFGLLTVAGTTTAVVLHLCLTVLGMAGGHFPDCVDVPGQRLGFAGRSAARGTGDTGSAAQPAFGRVADGRRGRAGVGAGGLKEAQGLTRRHGGSLSGDTEKQDGCLASRSAFGFMKLVGPGLRFGFGSVPQRHAGA